jgi:hypothetical protein
VQLSDYLKDAKQLSSEKSKNKELPKRKNNDWFFDEFTRQCMDVTKHLILMSKTCFKCETEHEDRVGIRVENRFYVDV